MLLALREVQGGDPLERMNEISWVLYVSAAFPRTLSSFSSCSAASSSPSYTPPDFKGNVLYLSHFSYCETSS